MQVVTIFVAKSVDCVTADVARPPVGHAVRRHGPRDDVPDRAERERGECAADLTLLVPPLLELLTALHACRPRIPVPMRA